MRILCRGGLNHSIADESKRQTFPPLSDARAGQPDAGQNPVYSDPFRLKNPSKMGRMSRIDRIGQRRREWPFDVTRFGMASAMR